MQPLRAVARRPGERELGQTVREWAGVRRERVPRRRAVEERRGEDHAPVYTASEEQRALQRVVRGEERDGEEGGWEDEEPEVLVNVYGLEPLEDEVYDLAGGCVSDALARAGPCTTPCSRCGC